MASGWGSAAHRLALVLTLGLATSASPMAHEAVASLGPNAGGGEPSARAPATVIFTRVRALPAGRLDARDLLDEAARRSRLIRAQLAALERTDLIVYVEQRLCEAAHTAYLRFLTVAGGSRFLRIVICAVGVRRSSLHANTTSVQIALLGHELQHALEIAALPAVRDSESLVAAFRRIGWRAEGSECLFETAAAIEVGHAVLAEVHEDPTEWRHQLAGAASPPRTPEP